MSNPAIDSDLQLLHDEGQSFFRRADAVRRLARQDEPEARQAVLAALQDKEAYVRRAAAEGLAHSVLHDELAAVLAAFADEKDEQVRRAQLKALAGAADAHVLDVVREVAETGSYSLRYDAQSAVTQIERRLAEAEAPAVAPTEEPGEEASAGDPTPLRPPTPADPVPPPAPVAEPEPVAEPGPTHEPEPVPQPEPGDAEEPATAESVPAVASAGVLEFRSFVLPELLLWVPATVWPGLALLLWMGRTGNGTWWSWLVAVAVVLWRRGVQFDGFTKSFWRWHGVMIPLRKRLCDYAGMTGVEVRERRSRLAEILPEACREYMCLELGRYDVVLHHSKEGKVRLKRFRNLAAALAAGRQAGEFLALSVTVNQHGKAD